MRLKTIILGSLIIALLGFFFWTEVYLTPMVEEKVTYEIGASFNKQDDPLDGKTYAELKELEIRSFPAFKLLLGKVDRAYLHLVNARISNLIISEIELTLKGVELSFLRSGTNDFSVLEKAKGLEGRLVILEKDLNNFIVKENFLPLTQPDISLNDGKVILMGQTRVFNAPVNVVITGTFLLSGGNQILYQPEDIKVEGIALPQFLMEGLLANITFTLDLGNLPIPVNFTELRVKNDAIELLMGK